LGYEDQFYLVMATTVLLALRYRASVPLVVAALAVAGLGWNLLEPGGWITGFFLEYWVHFAVGALLFYVLCVAPASTFRYLFLAAVSALGIYSLVRILPRDPLVPVDLRVYTEFVVVCGFALFLYFARPWSAAVSGWRVWQPVAALGTISYSLYLIHQFNLTLVEEAADRLAPHAWQPVKLGLMLALQILLASGFWYCCERPFLNRKPRQATLPQAAH
jgi:peptidoglycan/LPS O-acetylase OafA/YrhL